uniref:Uncharacterized protein n=1 Tax=Oryza meridionalis TaxID=40149 RepID=A0A0E0DPG0_9ORYZ
MEQSKQLDTIGHCRKFEAQPQMLQIAHISYGTPQCQTEILVSRLGETQNKNGIQQTPGKENWHPPVTRSRLLGVATAAAAAASLARRSGSAETPRSTPHCASTYAAASADWDGPASLDEDAEFDTTMDAPLRARPPQRQQPPEVDWHRNASGRSVGDGARRRYPIPSPATRQSPTHQTIPPLPPILLAVALAFELGSGSPQ